MVNLSRSNFNEKNTYQAYSEKNIYKCNDKNFSEVLSTILKSNSQERVLIELPSTIGLTDEIIESLTDNIDVRIVGGLTEEYGKSLKGDSMDHFREKATYSKEELKEIMSCLKRIESNINPEWNDYEKALYLYEYVKYNIVYRKNRDILPDGTFMDNLGNANRTRTWDSLIGLTNQLSTCSGFAHIYQELCTRQNISCVKVGGKYIDRKEGDHAWNVITIDGKNFIVDAIWDAQEFEKGNDLTTGFAFSDISSYRPSVYKELHSNLSSIKEEWVKGTKEKIDINIPKEQIAKEKVEHFLQMREYDRQRMMYLRQKQLESLTMNNIEENTIGGKSL